MKEIKTYDLVGGLELIEAPNLVALATAINKAITEAEVFATTATESALIAGDALIVAKKLVAHGEWENWLTTNCAIAVRTAQAYMRLAKAIPMLDEAKAQRVTDLPLREAFKAIATDPVAPKKSNCTNIRAVKKTDADKAVAVFGKAEKALKESKKLIGMCLTVKGSQVSDLRKKLNEVLAELERMEADSETQQGEVNHG